MKPNQPLQRVEQQRASPPNVPGNQQPAVDKEAAPPQPDSGKVRTRDKFPDLYASFLFVCKNQSEVNSKMAGEDWIERSQDGRIDYYFAGLDEMAELWRSVVQFKFWDESVLDVRNGKMELVDVFHFIVSSEVAANGVEDAAEAMTSGLVSWREAMESKHASAPTEASLARHIKRFTADLCCDRVNWPLFWFMIDGLNAVPGSAGLKLSWEEIVSLYRAKAVLNRFRTEQRSLPSGYRKIWVDGREDNSIMMAWLDTQEQYPGDEEVLRFLQSTYARVPR